MYSWLRLILTSMEAPPMLLAYPVLNRRRTIDIHTQRHTFGTHMCGADVTLRP